MDTSIAVLQQEGRTANCFPRSSRELFCEQWRITSSILYILDEMARTIHDLANFDSPKFL